MKNFKELRENLLTKVTVTEMRHKFVIDKAANLAKAEKIAQKLGMKTDSETGRNNYYLTVDDGGNNANFMKFLKQTDGLTEQVISEAMAKKISDKEARVIQKKYNLSLDQMQDLKKDYSPAKIARPKAWLSFGYPVRNGDYYFAFISSNEKENVKYNNLLNDVIKKAAKEVPAGEKPTEKADYIWDKASAAVKKFPRALGWNDTMAREEIWASIGHLIGVREDIDEIAIDKMRVGKRQKAPKWSR